ncbi:phenylalanine--tRNA ligase subunit alpha [Candidatus Fermentibacteria bacterium]|nr:phenylalanine--tRNA ligase subunit alpha [Candidatus Fermentibacteria bacterium]
MEELRDLHPLERELLRFLREVGESSDTEIVSRSGLPDEGSFRRAAEWLLSRGLVRESRREESATVELGPVGRSYLEKGTIPELALMEEVREGRTDFREIQGLDMFDNARWGSALGSLLRAGLVRKTDRGLELSSEGENVFRLCWKVVYEPLSRGEEVSLSGLPEGVADLVRSRSPKRTKSKAEFVIRTHVTRYLQITEKGGKALERSEEGGETVGAITPEMLRAGTWKGASFRAYKMDIPPSRIHSGRLHPYMRYLDAVRRKFVAMGFSEMRGPLVESEFWNNDALFMPQFHPARQIHDAYYVEEGLSSPRPEPEIVSRVAETHENGGDTGSRGWSYRFDRNRTLRAVMRSQGTALSARCLASGPEVPGKYFALARCFRYDQVDATHLPDFFQIEGIVLGEGINLRHLLGLLKMFAEEIAGAEEYRFQPGYFPFTEPSVELHVKHPALGWIEGGGAGLFRPEVCLPLGVEVPVIAWGLGLDRLAMLAMGLSDIRDLVTPDLSVLRRMKIRADKLVGGGGGDA